MVNRVWLNKSIFYGSWSISQKSPERVYLSRKLKVRGKSYEITVGYSSQIFKNCKNSEETASVIKNIVEKSEKNIKKYIDQQIGQSIDKSFRIPLEKKQAGNAGVRSNTKVSMIKKIVGKSVGKWRRLTAPRKKKINEHKLVTAISREYRKGMMLSEMQEIRLPIERINTKEIGAELAEKALKLIEELKLLGSEGRVNYQGKDYCIPTEDEYGRRKWEIKIDGRNFEINEFKEDAYNGTTTEDFQKRQDLIYQAATRFVLSKNLVKQDGVLKAIESLNRTFQKDIQSEAYAVDWKLIHQGEDLTEQYAEINQRATERIAQFAKDVQHVISVALGNDEFSIDDLDYCERNHVLLRDRPIILNTFNYANRKFLNMHVPEAKEYQSKEIAIPKNTIPSTLRDRIGLANYITSYGGSVSAAGKVKITYEAVRHSSYPPIHIADETLRQAISGVNVKQTLKDLAYKSLKAKPRKTSRENPLIIPLRSMMLFTPQFGDFLRNRSKFIAGKWVGEGEVLQLKESILALRMYHGRTIPLYFGGEIVWIKPDISMMNLGANPPAAGIGFFGKFPLDPIQEKINSRGFIEFVSEVEEILRSAGMPASCKQLILELEKFDKGTSNFLIAKDKANEILKINEVELSELYGDLEELYARYLTTKDAQLNSKIASKLGKIHLKEEEIYKAHKVLQQSMKENYLSNMELIQQKLNELALLLNTHLYKDDFDEGLVLIKNLVQNLHLAKKVYYEGGFSKPETVMEFQAIYIQIHSMLHNFVEFFCKSGEDRTGREDDKVQEREIFLNIHKKIPSSAEDYKVIKKVLALLVHQYSASQNTTEQNSNARGEQISQQINPEFPARQDVLRATMAKRVINIAKKQKPSVHALVEIAQHRIYPTAAAA